MDELKATTLWYYPPQTVLPIGRTPTVYRYFAKRLLALMPRKLWHVKLVCPRGDCSKNELTGAGIYHHVRQVLDVHGHYNLAAEYLECSKCKSKFISWSAPIVNQLDVGHRSQFPLIITYNYACDMRVVRLLRQRGLGNSAMQLHKKLEEQHNEAWLNCVAQYLTKFQTVVDASRKGLVALPRFDDPPNRAPVPKYGWLLNVYCRDMMSRLEEVKASFTSIFGKVLKIDSTKKASATTSIY